MAADGNLSVQLVEAETKEPFKEHSGRNGETYAEVEPGAEYFVAIDPRGLKDGKTFICKLSVDGQHLRYNITMQKATKIGYYGVWRYADGSSTDRALCFQKPRLDLAAKASARAGGDELMGYVQIDIYEGINPVTITRENYSTSFSDSSLVTTLSADALKKKIIFSGKGSHEETQTISTTTVTYQCGTLLKSIKIHYCSAPGLFAVGILDAPPAYMTKTRAENTSASDDDSVYSDFIGKPQVVKSGGVMVNGVMVVPPKDCEYVDMTTHDANDDEQKPSRSGVKTKSAKKKKDGGPFIRPPKQVVLFDLTDESKVIKSKRKMQEGVGRRASLPRRAKQVKLECGGGIDLTASSDDDEN